MNRTTHNPAPAPGNSEALLVERPEGFYWQDPRTRELSGPYPSALDAVESLQLRDEEEYQENESLQEMEHELGISDWMDPGTGELVETAAPHLSDE